MLVANTLALASRADEFAVCIIILRPGQWRTTPVITTAIRCNPCYMVPVLAEPMSLPNSSWSTDAVNIKEPLSETVHELAEIINKRLQSVVQDAQIDQKQFNKNAFLQPKVLPTLRSTIYRRNRMRLNSIRKYVLIALLFVLLSGIGIYYLSHSKFASQSTNVLPEGSPISLSSFGQSYTINVPGPDCNTLGNSRWSVGEYFKTAETSTATAVNTNTAPKETPTPHVIVDNSTKTTCRQDGLYVEHTDHYSNFAEIFFHGNEQEALPQHFSTQITANALNASNAATFTLAVRSQIAGEASYDRGYGNEDLDVGVDGSWRTVRINDETDQVDKTFTRGYVKPSQTVTMGAEVEGARITFYINGQKVTTIVDTTYANGYSIGFGLGDSKAKSPPRSLVFQLCLQATDKHKCD